VTTDCDLLVVGAGIHGAGVAQAAAAAGWRVVLIEQAATPAQGTSSRSSKLIHGGLRYLEGGHLGLVHECLRERALLLRNAPHLVRLLPMHLPVYRDSRLGPWRLGAGLALYALLGGLRPANRCQRLPAAAWASLDGLRRDGLRAVYRYAEAQADDAALTRAVVASAVGLGATLHCDTELIGAVLDGAGGRATVRIAGSERRFAFRVLVNTGGPWLARVLARITPAPPAPAIELVRGAHIVLQQPTVAGGYYIESPQDRRPVFVLPWRGGTLVGTTEVEHAGDPGRVVPSADEIDYLLQAYAHHFPGRPAGRDAVAGSFAGLRVLPAGAGRFGARSRETLLLADRPDAPRLVSVVGGKLTSYRATAACVIERIRATLPPAQRVARTEDLALE
jgi:glycerol-3-phosphate dehydrogenase